MKTEKQDWMQVLQINEQGDIFWDSYRHPQCKRLTEEEARIIEEGRAGDLQRKD